MIGEYGDVLLTSPAISAPVDEGATDGIDGVANAVPEQIQGVDVVDLLENVLSSPYANTIIRQYVVIAATKFSTRLQEVAPGQESLRQRLESLVKGFNTSIELEIQQRSVELSVLLSTFDKQTAMGVLERMPPPELKANVMGTGPLTLDSSGRLVDANMQDSSLREARCWEHSCRQGLAAGLDER